MTMPMERTRALRFGWEFLQELQAADNLTEQQQLAVKRILRHFPSAAEIKTWAASFQATPHDFPVPWLLPEDVETASSGSNSGPETVERGDASPGERMQSLLAAFEFFKFELQGNGANLNVEQRRQLQFVLRHFPRPSQIEAWANVEARLQKTTSGRRVWLGLPPPNPSAI